MNKSYKICLEAQLLSKYIDVTDSLRYTVFHGTFSYFGHISVVCDKKAICDG